MLMKRPFKKEFCKKAHENPIANQNSSDAGRSTCPLKRHYFLLENLLLSFFLLFPFFALSQDNDSTVTLDLLKAPSSPAFNLLGISPSAIERPTDLNSFRVSVQNASNDFTRLPSDYSVEIAPATLAGMKNQTLDKFGSTSFKDVFWQSLGISLGLTHGNAQDMETNDSTSFAKLGCGIKFSIIRPHWSAKTRKLFTDLQNAQMAFLDSAAYHNKSAEIDKVKGMMIAVEMAKPKLSEAAKKDSLSHLSSRLESLIQAQADALNKLLQDTTGNSFSALKNAAKNFTMERVGGFLDFASGMALDFPGNSFNYSLTSKAGAWLTGGYENGNKGISVLGIARYLYQPAKLYANSSNDLLTANISTLDAGARLIYTGLEGKFTLSAEALYRSVLTSNTISPDWRYTFNTEYEIGLNKKLTLALGKNFDGTTTKSGNIIAMLNLIAGFGSSKRIISR
jgi:hypothetical protein